MFLSLGSDNQAEFEKHLDGIDRLLHNFLASAFTLSEHIQAVRKKQANEAFDAEYARHHPFDEPVCHLVKHLRRDAQHAHLPVVQQREVYEAYPEPTLSCKLVVSRAYLETLELNGRTRQYLATLNGDPAIDDLVDRYVVHVEQFTTWFIGAIVELRADDLRQTFTLRERAHRLAEPLRRAISLHHPGQGGS